MESAGEIVQELRSRLVELAEGKLSADAIDPSRHLFDHGYVDSLSAVMLLAYIEERWGVEIEDTQLLAECSTLDAIARRIVAGA
jgi:acyl carrier protein